MNNEIHLSLILDRVKNLRKKNNKFFSLLMPGPWSGGMDGIGGISMAPSSGGRIRRSKKRKGGIIDSGYGYEKWWNNPKIPNWGMSPGIRYIDKQKGGIISGEHTLHGHTHNLAQLRAAILGLPRGLAVGDGIRRKRQHRLPPRDSKGRFIRRKRKK